MLTDRSIRLQNTPVKICIMLLCDVYIVYMLLKTASLVNFAIGSSNSEIKHVYQYVVDREESLLVIGATKQRRRCYKPCEWLKA